MTKRLDNADGVLGRRTSCGCASCKLLRFDEVNFLFANLINLLNNSFFPLPLILHGARLRVLEDVVPLLFPTVGLERPDRRLLLDELGQVPLLDDSPDLGHV